MLKPELWVQRIGGDDIVREVLEQVPTHVWYSAYGDLTALNIAQNERIRAGLHGDPDEREWVQSL